MSARKVIESFSVLDYGLPATLKKVFACVDDLRRYTTEVCGKPDIKFVRLTKEQFFDLDDVIQRKSDKRFNVRMVNYRGLPIISETDAAPI